MQSQENSKQCLWCLKSNEEVHFIKKAHTIPVSLGGQNFNKNVCDDCNYYFGNRECHNGKYSIEVALKEAFNITRKRFLTSGLSKRKVGEFKSQFFEIKERKGKYRIVIKDTFRFSKGFQEELCRAFKRGLIKMYFEELNRQTGKGYERNFDLIRDFARHNKGEFPVFYFYRKIGMIMMLAREAETPILYFDKMKYLISNDKFCEIEFLGHVFGFPISDVSEDDFKKHILQSVLAKKEFFSSASIINKLTDIDLTMRILND